MMTMSKGPSHCSTGTEGRGDLARCQVPQHRQGGRAAVAFCSGCSTGSGLNGHGVRSGRSTDTGSGEGACIMAHRQADALCHCIKSPQEKLITFSGFSGFFWQFYEVKIAKNDVAASSGWLEASC